MNGNPPNVVAATIEEWHNKGPRAHTFGASIAEKRGTVTLDLPWSGWVADDEPKPGIARGVLAMVMDTLLGYSISIGLPNRPPCTTIDLRMDWTGPVVAGAPLKARVDRFAGKGNLVLASGSMWQGDETSPCAIGSGRFLAGSFPGRQSTRTQPGSGSPTMPEGAASFSRFLGLEAVGDGRFILPGTARLAGMAQVGAFHGGFIAAASDRAAESLLKDWAAPGGARCVTLEIEYLRPAFVSSDLLVEARVLRLGRSAASVEIVTRQQDWNGPMLTCASSLWIREQGAG